MGALSDHSPHQSMYFVFLKASMSFVYTQNKHSLTKDGRQIALFTTEDEGKTRIDFAEQDGTLIPFLILFAIFIDIRYYAYRGTTTHTFFPRDKHEELSKWTPE